MNYEKELDKILLKVQRPSRYVGGEVNEIRKNREDCALRFAFCFPDTYEIGMSHLGMKILYSLINEREEYACERAFMPLPDMEALMRENDIPLYALESLEPLRDFDIIGFTLQYELCYTTVLCMLDLAGLPVLKEERAALNPDLSGPFIIAGGPCACNPEPLSDFIDLFVIGEGEEVTLELMDLLNACKKAGLNRRAFLEKAALIRGVYVPEFYEVAYNADGTIKSKSLIAGLNPQIPTKIKKRYIKDFDKVFFPEKFIVPFAETVHDRAVTEVLRGCIRGCRFCQAGFIYRPMREKQIGTVLNQARALCENTGYDEVSLCSLSTSDYSDIEGLLGALADYTDKNNISLSLPSLRADKFSGGVVERVKSVRKSTLTFAPEAGTQRLRDVINKNITEADVLKSCRIAFEGGYSGVKLYFMLGLPTETTADIEGIYALAEKVERLYYEIAKSKSGQGGHNQGVKISVSVSTFVPKPFTPFQYEPQASGREIEEKQKQLLSVAKSRKIRVSRSDRDTSLLEAVLARGDRRLGAVIHSAWRKGCYLDSWGEHFKPELWFEALGESGLDAAFYANRRRDYNEITPWSHIDMLVTEAFLIEENKKAHN